MPGSTVRYTTAAITTAVREHIGQLAEEGNLVDQFVSLTVLKRDLDEVKRKLAAELSDREAELLEDMVDNGQRRIGHTATNKTVYINRKVWARVVKAGKVTTPEEHAVTAAALREAGLSDYQGVKVATAELSAYFRELLKQESARREASGEQRPVELQELLPAPVRGFIDLTEDTVLGLK